MRALWAGETVSTTGRVRVANARLYSKPGRPPLLVGAALGPETARWLGGWADGMITVAAPRQQMRAVADAFREGGGEGKPMFLQVALSFAPSDLEADAAAYEQWRHSALPRQQLADLPTAAAFDRQCAHASPEEVRGGVRVSSDIERHLSWLIEDAALGFERIYLHNVARRHQARFIEACGTRLIPALGMPAAGA
jgi:alkanesulfonate monooxygenase SsuD/methylene tetrahydromethanopterin reductase-like flavin-dependent oxidoreductase (luciferase family)